MSSAAAAPWESPWPRRPPPGPLLLLVLLASCAAPARCAGASTTPATPARPASTPAPAAASQAQGAALERYRRLIPYMTYYVAQGLTQSRSPALPAALQTVHNGLDAYSPPPGRLRGGAGGGYLLPTYVVRPAPAPAAPPRAHGAAHSAAPAAGQPPRTLFRFDFQQGQQRPGKVRDQPFLPSPPLTPDNKDSDDYFKPVTDTANYYRGVAAPAAPAPTAAPEQHLVVFPEDDARLRAKLRQQQRKQNQHQLLLQQHQSQQQQLLDDAYRLKLLVLQQQQLQQAKEFRAQLQAQRLREQLRAHHQQEHEVRALVQAQQAKRHREQQQQLQLQAQFQAQQQAQDLKKLREQQLRQDQELQAQLQVQAQVQQQAEDAKAVQALREQQLQVRIRAHELKKLRAQQARQQQDHELQAQLQAQQAKQDEELRAHVHVEEQRALQRHKAQREHALRPFRVHEHADRPADAPAPAPASAPASAPSNDADTEVEQQVVVSLEEVEKMLPPSAAGSDAPSGPAHTEVLIEPEVQPSARPDHPDAVQAKPVVYAEEAAIAPVAQNVAPPSSSRELVAHLINGLQLSNKLPQTLTPDNFDMSLKTILQLLKILHKSKAPDGPVTTPAKVKVSPESPERDTSFYIGGGTVSQTFPAPSVEGSTPGRPGIDYPAYDSIPQTKFSCATQRYKGFFGDPETNCQVWHYCDLNGGQASFLCPNGTIFSQVGLTCDWWFNVRCASTAQLYVLNERLYKYILPVKPSFPEDYSGPDVDRYLTEKFREMQAKARGRKEKLKAKENKGAAATDASEQPEESVETNQTEDHEAPKSSEVVKEKEVEEQQKLDPDL